MFDRRSLSRWWRRDCTALLSASSSSASTRTLVMDVAFWVFQEGTAVNWVGGGSDSHDRQHASRIGIARTAICLVNHPHLYLGVFDPENVDNYSGPRSDGLLSTDEGARGTIGCCFPMGFGASCLCSPTGRTSSSSGAGAFRANQPVRLAMKGLTASGEVRISVHEQFSALERSQQRDDV